MNEIKLSRGLCALVDDEDFDSLSKFKWFAHKDCKTFYARRNYTKDGVRKTIDMHRQILDVSDCSIQIDHADCDGLNNQRFNLRKCSNSQNRMNVRPAKNTSSKFKGVCWHKLAKKWGAGIGVNKKRIHLGYFKSEELAAKAYDVAATKYFGEFSRLNFNINI